MCSRKLDANSMDTNVSILGLASHPSIREREGGKHNGHSHGGEWRGIERPPLWNQKEKSFPKLEETLETIKKKLKVNENWRRVHLSYHQQWHDLRRRGIKELIVTKSTTQLSKV